MSLRWLGIHLDSKLNFKSHVERRVNEATRVFHQIARLANTERGLSFQAIRQLYIACTTTIADFGVQIWWNNQKNLLEKFQKLQNYVIKKITGAFKTLSTKALELEALTPPPEIRFQKLCQNYAIRIMRMYRSHPIV